MIPFPCPTVSQFDTSIPFCVRVSYTRLYTSSSLKPPREMTAILPYKLFVFELLASQRLRQNYTASCCIFTIVQGRLTSTRHCVSDLYLVSEYRRFGQIWCLYYRSPSRRISLHFYKHNLQTFTLKNKAKSCSETFVFIDEILRFNNAA